jgi:hypothetical protein
MDWLRWRSQRLSACFSEPRIRSSMRDLLVRYNEWVILRYAWAEATTVLQTPPLLYCDDLLLRRSLVHFF